jgi:hypothetical protein
VATASGAVLHWKCKLHSNEAHTHQLNFNSFLLYLFLEQLTFTFTSDPLVTFVFSSFFIFHLSIYTNLQLSAFLSV